MDIFDIYPIVNNITNNLNFIDTWSLRIASKSVNDLLPENKKIFKKVFIDRLNKLGFDGEDLDKEIAKSKFCVSGSFILSCLLSSFKPNDIDIYCQGEEKDVSSILKGKYTIVLPEFEHIYESDVIPLGPVKYYLTTSKTPLNSIVVYTKISEHIKNDFDISMCKNYYDGEKLHIFNPLELIKREGTVIIKSLNTQGRIEKYTQRGFKLTIINPL